MNKNDKITIALPDGIVRTGIIKEVVPHYVVEFPESDLTPTNECITTYRRLHRTLEYSSYYWHGYIYALWRENLITYKEWKTLGDELDEE